MSQYLAVFELASLDGNNGFQINGEAAGDESGYSVSSAGDVNGDGFGDLIVGARGADLYAGLSGTSYVVFGKASGFDATLELLTLDNSTGFRIFGESGSSYSGSSVASAGDVNGDGFDDVIVGAYGADPNGNDSGASYVVFGKASGFGGALALSSLDGNNGFQINGEATYDLSGLSVSSAGDVNGDGLDDLIVGAFGAQPAGFASGASYVVFGKASGFGATFELSGLDGNNGFQINGEVEGDFSGVSVSSAGDFNGDGFIDIIVGASNANPNGYDSGASYVVFGKLSGFGATLELSSLDGNNGFQINGEATNDYSGRSVSSAGDVNGDGFGDVIVGAYHADPNGGKSGASYVVFGAASGFGATLDLSGLDGNNGFQISGETAGDRSGCSVSSAGDFNGDGFDDVIVGAHRADPNGLLSGASYVVFGKASGFGATFELSSLDGNNGFQINGEVAGDNSGRSVSAAGDVNGDGFADLIVGAYGADPNGSESGTSYVIFGAMPGEAVFRTGTDIANTIHGGSFNDVLDGGAGHDVLLGHGGKDTLRGGEGVDVLNGGGGKNTATYINASGGVWADLVLGGFLGDANGDTYINIGDLIGSIWNDTLIGDAFDNTLSGSIGNDTLSGHGGSDILNGGKGHDLLEGGDGKDTLIAGPGVDRFVYGTAADSSSVNYDAVKAADFGADEWDVQGSITGIDATIASGNLSTNNFDVKLAAAADAAHLAAQHAVVFTPTNGNLAGRTFLVVDQNGVAGYQAGNDLVIELKSPVNLAGIDTGDFI